MNAYVIIDNGHGVNTAGKSSPDGRYQEWAWTRRAARALKAELDRRGVAAELLVEEDTDISLATRCKRVAAIYRRHSDAILISLHSNASGLGAEWGSASGWSAWVSHNASVSSRRLACLLTSAAKIRGLEGNRATPACGYWTANLAICRDTPCPAVLTENMLHDNRADVEFLLSDAGMAQIVGLHADAIASYCNEN